MSVEDRLAALREHVDSEIAAIREESAVPQAAGADVASDPEVRKHAEALARAVAKAQGVDLPLQVAEGSTPAVLELPEEFQRYGGVGVSIMIAPPTEAARAA